MRANSAFTLARRCRRRARSQSQAPATRRATGAASPTVSRRKAEIVLVDVNVVDRDAKPVPTLTPTRLRARGQRPAAQDRDRAVHLDDADQHHRRDAARDGLHLERDRDHRPPAAVRGRRRQPARRRQSHRAAQRRNRCSNGWRRATWSAWRACRPASAASSSPTDRKRITDALMRVTGAAEHPRRA